MRRGFLAVIISDIGTVVHQNATNFYFLEYKLRVESNGVFYKILFIALPVFVIVGAVLNQKSPQTMEVPNTHPLAYKYGVGMPCSATPAGAPFGALYVVGAAFATNPQYPYDAPNMGFAVLSFFLPVVGLILYLVWKDQFPLKAKSCGKGALIGALVEIILPLIIFGVFVVIVALL